MTDPGDWHSSIHKGRGQYPRPKSHMFCASSENNEYFGEKYLEVFFFFSFLVISVILPSPGNFRILKLSYLSSLTAFYTFLKMSVNLFLVFHCFLLRIKQSRKRGHFKEIAKRCTVMEKVGSKESINSTLALFSSSLDSVLFVLSLKMELEEFKEILGEIFMV